jgi:hypothetical protein
MEKNNMGFDKRFITKSRIINNIGNISYISRLIKADSVILDDWSSKFYKNFSHDYEKYQDMREVIISDTLISSNLNDIKEHTNFRNLKKLSNILYNLKLNPSWVDIQLVSSILERGVPENISGKFEQLVDYYIEAIITELEK